MGLEWPATRPLGFPRLLLIVQDGGGGRLLRVVACRLSSLVQNGRRLPVERTAVLRSGPALVLVGVNGPSSGLFPELAALSPPYLPSLGQQGYGVRPGGGRWSSWHRWSSLIPPSGGTMPLVRGEEKPGGVAFSSMGGRRRHLVSRRATNVLLIARASVGDFLEATMMACSLMYVVSAPQFVA